MITAILKKITEITIIAAILFLIVVSGYLEASLPVKCRQFEFTYEATIKDIPQDSKNVRIWVPYPQDNPCQKISRVTIEGVSDYRIYRSGRNKILFIEIKRPEVKNVSFNLRYNVRRNEELHKVLFSKAVSRAREIYDYVFDNMSYDKAEPGWGEGDVERACRVKKGNCTDFHSLFIALAKEKKIPSMFLIGFKLPKDKKGAVGGYHCWAEFYTRDAGWLPVDISEAWKDRSKRDYYFGNLCEDRVQLSEGRSIILTPRQAGEPLNYFIYPYVELDGKPYEKVEKSFRFKDI